jgi:glycolate oxidase FAD binding subunit
MSASPAACVARLGEIAGSGNLITDPQLLARYEIDGVRPAMAARPGSAEEVAEMIRFAAAEKLAVVPVGAGTKLRMGMPPVRYHLALDMTRLDRVLSYDPADLTLRVEAGVRLADLQRVLAEKNQFLPLAVPFAHQATLGGVLATNSTSPLRQFYGTARDFVLGMQFVAGDGVPVKSGGQVVKNVAGYDLHKLLIGALGTLGVITSVNFKTFPLPPASSVFVASFLGANAAVQFRHAIAASPLLPHAVEIVDPGAAALLNGSGDQPPILPATEWSVVVAAAGNQGVVERHGRELEQLARATEPSAFASFTELPHADKEQLMSTIREFPAVLLGRSPDALLIRVPVLPKEMTGLLEGTRSFAMRHGLPYVTLLRGAGILYFAIFPQALDPHGLARLAKACGEFFETSAQVWRTHPVIEWCPADLKRLVNVWGPPREDFPLMETLKKTFDPQGILSPGRFVGGL